MSEEDKKGLEEAEKQPGTLPGLKKIRSFLKKPGLGEISSLFENDDKRTCPPPKPCPPPCPPPKCPPPPCPPPLCCPPPCPKPCPPPPCPKPCPPPPCEKQCPPPPCPKPCPPPPCPEACPPPPCPKPCPPPPCPPPCPPPPPPPCCPPPCPPPIPPVCMPKPPVPPCDDPCPPPCCDIPDPCNPCDPCYEPPPPAPTAPCRCPPAKLPCCCKPPPPPPPPPCCEEKIVCLPPCPEPPPPKKDPCPPFKCPFPKCVKIPCTIDPCDESGKRPCVQYQCIREDNPTKPCTPDPNCPDEITLQCTMEDGVTKCVQYVCKEKVKELVCSDSSESEMFKTFEEPKTCPQPTWPCPCEPYKPPDVCDSPLADFDCPLLPEFYTPSEKSESTESSCGNICCYDTLLRAKIAEPIGIDPMELWKKEPRPCPYCPPVGKICMEQYGCLPVECEVVEHDDEAPPEPECVEEEPCEEEPQPECCPKQETEIYIECVVEVECPTDDCPVCPPPPIEIDPPCGKTSQGCWDMMLKEKLDKDLGIDPEELRKPRPKTDVTPFASDGCTVCCKVTMDDEEVQPPLPDECPPSCMPQEDNGEPRKGCPPGC